MKIRTVEELQDAVDKDMAWRKHELSAIRAAVLSSRKSAKDTAIRSGIALLYAHWEGAIKNIATYYLSYVSTLALPYGRLKPNFLAIASKNGLAEFEATNKTSLHTALIISIIQSQGERSRIPVDGIIKTNSNLNSMVFAEIMATIGLDSSEYEGAYKLIDTVLLDKRNRIAHGEQLEMLDLDEARYIEIHDKIRDMMQQFANQVTNAASLRLYLEQPLSNYMEEK